MSNRNKLISLAPRRPKPVWRHMPSLREFWEELQRSQSGADAPSSMRAGSGSITSSGRGSGRVFGSGSGSARGSGSSRRFGSGSGSGSTSDEDCGGYGIGLVLPDGDAQERIMKIMRELCAKDAARQPEAKNN